MWRTSVIVQRGAGPNPAPPSRRVPEGRRDLCLRKLTTPHNLKFGAACGEVKAIHTAKSYGYYAHLTPSSLSNAVRQLEIGTCLNQSVPKTVRACTQSGHPRFRKSQESSAGDAEWG